MMEGKGWSERCDGGGRGRVRGVMEGEGVE